MEFIFIILLKITIIGIIAGIIFNIVDSSLDEVNEDTKPECNPKLKKWVNIAVLPIKYLWYYSVILGFKICLLIKRLLLSQDNEGCN